MGDEATVDLERGVAVFEPLTSSVRRLIDATIRTDVGDQTATAARSLVDEAVGLLEQRRLSGRSFGVRHSTAGSPVVWGNAVIGLRNPIAPPLIVQRNDDDGVWAEFELGAAYEGPPGHVHGGICAMILDHVLGATAHRPGSPAFTGTLTIRYRRPTPLGPLRVEGWSVREEGVKTFASGRISDSGGPTVEADGVFIRQR